ncbi:MAG: N-acetylmuramoyl-L-alanine amidase, partial [bacterium]
VGTPPRYAVDYPGILLDQKYAAPFAVGSPSFKSLRVGQFEAAPPVARVVYDLIDAGFKPAAALVKGTTRLTLSGPGASPVVPVPEVSRAPITISLGPAGTGISIQGFHLTGATLELVDGPQLQVRLARVQLPAPASDYVFAKGMPDLGIRRIHVENSSENSVLVTITLLNAAPNPRVGIETLNGDVVVEFNATEASPQPSFMGNGVRGKVIVIDPGHGGPWPGAVIEKGVIGDTQLIEENLTLRMGLDLADRLKAAGAIVHLTRSSDAVYHADDLKSDLVARRDLATTTHADLFVSIHCNSYKVIPSTALQGTEVYYSKPGDRGLCQVLFDHMSARSGRGGRGALRSKFVVCQHPTIPSVLVETGYLCNPDEYALFADAKHDYETTLMTGLAEGITAWCNGNTGPARTALPHIDPQFIFPIGDVTPPPVSAPTSGNTAAVVPEPRVDTGTGRTTLTDRSHVDRTDIFVVVPGQPATPVTPAAPEQDPLIFSDDPPAASPQGSRRWALFDLWNA